MNQIGEQFQSELKDTQPNPLGEKTNFTYLEGAQDRAGFFSPGPHLNDIYFVYIVNLLVCCRIFYIITISKNHAEQRSQSILDTWHNNQIIVKKTRHHHQMRDYNISLIFHLTMNNNQNWKQLSSHVVFYHLKTTTKTLWCIKTIMKAVIVLRLMPSW